MSLNGAKTGAGRDFKNKPMRTWKNHVIEVVSCKQTKMERLLQLSSAGKNFGARSLFSARFARRLLLGSVLHVKLSRRLDRKSCAVLSEKLKDGEFSTSRASKNQRKVTFHR